ncbi:hypothetical protein DJ533_11385 [Acinetobacter defluvii]|uniref:Uncharacterized protein n=1 Tax=Acinetobacter defluvii TaxID=1871111 RepID=A0A2S2FDU1_9GAMM|nr:hypothetical protein [Acinetobacter defluvii]AWL29124.1 hypothetical protein DJ533_11385 [Acinetobacter defluvii]
MIISQILRALAIIFLLIASLCVIGGNGSFCLYEYAGQNTVWSLDQLNGGISNDPSIFGISAMTALIFFFAFTIVLSSRLVFAIFCCVDSSANNFPE